MVTAYMGIWISNPVTWVPQYLLAYEVGRHLLFRGEPLTIPAHADLAAFLDLLWRGGLALQVGGSSSPCPRPWPPIFSPCGR
jgi:hypothetical protein